MVGEEVKDVGVTKEEDVNLEEIKDSHTLGGVGEVDRGERPPRAGIVFLKITVLLA